VYGVLAFNLRLVIQLQCPKLEIETAYAKDNGSLGKISVFLIEYGNKKTILW
jgi:hypothetical protein